MPDEPELPDPAFERLARAVEVGTFRALTRFAAWIVGLWVILALVFSALVSVRGDLVVSALLLTVVAAALFLWSRARRRA